MNTTLQANNLAFAYEAQNDLFTGVTTSITTGIFTAIAGPNGAGKSTLLRILAGLLHPRQGTVHLDGRPLRAIRPRERAKRIAFLPQTISPAISLTVFETICLGRYPHTGPLGALQPHDLDIARRCLQQTQTADLHDRDFTTLSGGERQRVLLASILAQEPALLLLDEPTSALDIHHQAEIFALLKNLTRNGYGIAVVTHDLNMAAQFCDRILLIAPHQGLIAAGSPREVLTAPLLSRAYNANITVADHPITHTPLVSAIPPPGDSA